MKEISTSHVQQQIIACAGILPNEQFALDTSDTIKFQPIGLVRRIINATGISMHVVVKEDGTIVLF